MIERSRILITCILILSSCAPKVSTTLTTNYLATDHDAEVRVFGLDDPIPINAIEVGVIRIGDTGFTTNCSWNVVIDKARMEARKAGGNAIKITNHIPPNFFGSTCHRITATILRVEDFDDIQPVESIDSSLLHADYALLHVYRQSGIGTMVNFDLHLGDTVICRVSNKWKKTIKIRKEGSYLLWAKTEVREELPLNIQFGNAYYVRCGVTMGAFVGRPSLQLVSNETGKYESQSIKMNPSKKTDRIILNDGREIECQLNSEDDDNFYFTILKNKKEVKTQISKTQVKSIE